MNFKSSFQRVMCLGNEFDIKKHSMEEIVLATCRSEIVHELNALVSFVSLLFTLFFGDFFVFLFTAIAAACLDLVFVIMQRFNRPRLARMIKKKEKVCDFVK